MSFQRDAEVTACLRDVMFVTLFEEHTARRLARSMCDTKIFFFFFEAHLLCRYTCFFVFSYMLFWDQF